MLSVTIPANQQTRFALDGSTLLNRIRVEITQSGKPSGDLRKIRSVRLYRAGDKKLRNIDNTLHRKVFFVLASLRFRRGCKGTAAAAWWW